MITDNAYDTNGTDDANTTDDAYDQCWWYRWCLYNDDSESWGLRLKYSCL